MPRTNEQVAAAFERESKLLTIERANPFRIRAYRNAADTIRRLGRPLQDMLAEGQDLSELPTIGKDLAHQIEEILATGKSSQLRATEQEVTPSLIELLDIPGLGPARVNALNRELGIETRAQLEQALREGRVAQLAGFGRATQQRLLAEIAALPADSPRMLLADAISVAEPLVTFLRSRAAVSRATVCGSFRRAKPTVGDLDIVLESTMPEQALREAATYPAIETSIMQGETRSTYRLVGGVHVDVRAVRPAAAGSALVYFTGNKAHNIKLRRRAHRRGHKLNEYGLFDGDKNIAGATEKSIYATLGLQYIPPELRHGTDEIDRAQAKSIPKLIESADSNGDFHILLPNERAQEALINQLRKLKFGFAGLVKPWQCHSRDPGKQANDIQQTFQALDTAIGRRRTPRIFKGLRVVLSPSGEIDIPEGLLSECDYLIASVEDDFKLSRKRQTARVLAAMAHPKTRILAHPICRDLQRFSGLSLDLDRVFATAVREHCWLEINGDPHRLDLPAVQCRRAAAAGVTLCLGSGAAAADQSIERLRYAISVARRGWLRRGDVINCKAPASICVDS